MSTKTSSQKAAKSGSVAKKGSKASKGKNTTDKTEEGHEETVWVEPAQFSEEEEDEPEYEVEEIIGKKIKRGVIYYQVKWKGFSVEDATWEPEDNLDHAPLKIRAYENQLLDTTNEASAKDKKTKGEAAIPNTKGNGKDTTVSTKLSALAAKDDSDSMLGKRSRDDVDAANSKTTEQEDKKKNKNALDSKKASTNGTQKEEKGAKKVDKRSLEEKERIEETASKDNKLTVADKPKQTEGRTSSAEEKVSDSKEKKDSMEEEKIESTKTKKNDQTTQQASGAEKNSSTRPNKDEGISLSRIMQDDKLMEGSETEEPSATEPRETDAADQNKTNDRAKKGKQKEQGEYGSLEKDIPLKVIGIRPIKEQNDLEVMVSWKPRENGIKPYNSKIMRLALLNKGYWMPLIEFYESKMKLESAPTFDPTLLPRCNP